MLIEFESKYGHGSFDVDNQELVLNNEVYRYPIKWQKRPGRLYIIFSTECNLRCGYCFQNCLEKISASIMVSDLYSYIEFFQNRISEIVLFGGEPFLDSNYEYISSVLKRFDYLNFIVFTNGNFSTRYRELITQYSYCIQSVIITLDGYRDVHNERRVNPIKDSYQTILDNLQFLAEKNVVLDVQLNTDKLNAESMYQLFTAVINDKKLSRLDYTLNPVKYIRASLSYEELLELYFDLRSKFNQRIFVNNRLVMNLIYLFSGRPLLKDRCALDLTYVLSLPNGTIYSCPQNPSSLVGEIKGGKIIIDKSQLMDKVDITQYKSSKCMQCRYTYLCPYCCPYAPEIVNCVDTVEALLKIAFQHIDSILEIKG